MRRAVRWVTDRHLDPEKLLGHQQVTDAHLAALCLHRAGGLVTFDKAVRHLLPSARVELLA